MLKRTYLSSRILRDFTRYILRNQALEFSDHTPDSLKNPPLYDHSILLKNVYFNTNSVPLCISVLYITD